MSSSEITMILGHGSISMCEALTKAREILMKLEPDERLVIGTAYCGQNLRTGEILGSSRQRTILKPDGLSTRAAKKNYPESSRLISASGRKELLSISSVTYDGNEWRFIFIFPFSNRFCTI